MITDRRFVLILNNLEIFESYELTSDLITYIKIANQIIK